MDLQFSNKVALVTGAGRGIGKAIALSLGSEGVHVICVSQSASCEAVASEIQAAGGSAEACSVDVSNAEAVKAACEAMLEKHGCVDIIVNNAGITRDSLLLRMKDEDWDAVLQTNLTSCFYWVKGLLHPMTRKRDGRIINIASVVGLNGNPGQANYCAAKAGMIGFSKSLAKELGGRNVTVNTVAPGFIETDMTSELKGPVIEMIQKSIPLKRMGKAQDIANMVTYLASDQAGYITGQVFTVDGGLVM